MINLEYSIVSNKEGLRNLKIFFIFLHAKYH
jgi:hypothetical protein